MTDHNGDRPSNIPAGLPATRREFPTLPDLPEHPDATEMARTLWAIAMAYHEAVQRIDERLHRIEVALHLAEQEEQ